MEIISVSNPVYSKIDNSMIDCTIVCEFGTIPFTASSNDSEEYGRNLFADLVAGKYGEISAYVPPAAPTIKQQIAILENSITARMVQESISGSENTFTSGIYAGKTAMQAIIIIRDQIDNLRGQL